MVQKKRKYNIKKNAQKDELIKKIIADYTKVQNYSKIAIKYNISKNIVKKYVEAFFPEIKHKRELVQSKVPDDLTFDTLIDSQLLTIYELDRLLLRKIDMLKNNDLALSSEILMSIAKAEEVLLSKQIALMDIAVKKERNQIEREKLELLKNADDKVLDNFIILENIKNEN